MMDYIRLLPSPDTVPASPWLFWLLGVITFMVHIVLVNAVLGGSIIVLFMGIKTRMNGRPGIQDILTGKIPSLIALAINFGVAPLLFIQVIYGTLYYSSSVIMAIFKMTLIPLLIVAYYFAYIYKKIHDERKGLSLVLLVSSICIYIYIAFFFAGNMTLMVRPNEWTAYFSNRSGTYFPAGDFIILPRLAHFIAASIAVGGIAVAVFWKYRISRGDFGNEEHIRSGLKIYAVATAVQFAVGPWYLFSQQSATFEALTGGKIGYTAVLAAGVVAGIASVVAALLAKLVPACVLFMCSIIAMVFTRANVRILDTAGFFTIETLPANPQYTAMILFTIVLVTGGAVMFYMVKKAHEAGTGGHSG